MSCITALNDEPNDVLSASSLGKKVHRWCSCCHKPSKVYKIFAPLISHPDLDLNGFQQTWMRESYLRYVQKIDRISIDALSRFKNIRRSLIVLGVLISGCIIVSETDHVKDHHVAANILFWVTMFISLMNNFVTAFLTDLKLAERAILFYRGSAYLQAMGQNFLTRTQRYAMFPSCGEGFRTFVRDVEMTKLLITSEDISLMSSSREQKPDDPISKERQSWPTLLDPLQKEEGNAMYELGLAKVKEVSIQVDDVANGEELNDNEKQQDKEPPLEEE